MKGYTKKQFLEIVESHKLWLSNDEKGKRAIFEKKVDMRGKTFDQVIDLKYATFKGDAYFSDATFEQYASFNDATFEGDADLREATFKGDAYFSDATFNKIAYFSSATFKGHANFWDAIFESGGYFSYATFESYVSFSDATFKGVVITKGMKIRGHELEKTYEPKLLKKVYDQIKKDPKSFDMCRWHSECGTTHCIAGWAVTLSKRGEELEKAVGTRVAGTLLLGIEASTYFVSSNKQVMSWLDNKFQNQS